MLQKGGKNIGDKFQEKNAMHTNDSRPGKPDLWHSVYLFYAKEGGRCDLIMAYQYLWGQYLLL